MGQSRPLLSFKFSLFKQSSLQILQQINVKKCPSSKLCWDLNPQPLQHESPSITTRPGLPPSFRSNLLSMFCLYLRLRFSNYFSHSRNSLKLFYALTNFVAIIHCKKFTHSLWFNQISLLKSQTIFGEFFSCRHGTNSAKCFMT